MRLDIQFKINNDIMLSRFLKEYSYWYKYLNRDPKYFDDFILDMKDKYELKTSDKLNRLMNNINLIQSFIDVFK